MNRLGIIVLVAIAIVIILIADYKPTVPVQQSTVAATTSVPVAQPAQAAPVQPIATQLADNPQLDQCIANATQQYDDAFIIQACEQSGYTKDDYEQGRCQLPFPEVQQVMLIKHAQKVKAIAACQQEYGSN